jgi:hypothetical protein
LPVRAVGIPCRPVDNPGRASAEIHGARAGRERARTGIRGAPNTARGATSISGIGRANDVRTPVSLAAPGRAWWGACIQAGDAGEMPEATSAKRPCRARLSQQSPGVEQLAPKRERGRPGLATSCGPGAKCGSDTRTGGAMTSRSPQKAQVGTWTWIPAAPARAPPTPGPPTRGPRPTASRSTNAWPGSHHPRRDFGAGARPPVHFPPLMLAVGG